MICSAESCDDGAMDLDTPGARLRWARSKAGFADAGTFAKAVGLKEVTYRAYENDQNGYAKRAPEFARRLGVSTDWLLNGGELPTVSPPAPPAKPADLPLPSVQILAEVLEDLVEEHFSEGLAQPEKLRSAAVELRVFLEQYAADPAGILEPAQARKEISSITRLSHLLRAVGE